MGVYRCNHCKYIGEHELKNITIDCEQCKKSVKVYDTIYFVKNIMTRWSAAVRELNLLKVQELSEEESSQENQMDIEYNLLSDVKLSETDILAKEAQHKPLVDWFSQSKITTEFDYSAVDMSGYYDEAAQQIAKQYTIFSQILGRICWSYRKEHTGLNIDLTKFSQKEGQIINSICRNFYSNTLFSSYNYRKKDKNIYLKLQKASPIRQFFNGTWLEWFALDSILSIAKQRGRDYTFSCARSAKIHFVNEDLHELDIVFLPSGEQPLIIECKTGEFRRDLDKYLKLRKKINLPAENFIILATDLDEAQAKSLSSMYDLTFSTLSNFSELLESHLQGA